MAFDSVLLNVGGILGAILLLVGLAFAYGGFVLYQLYIWLIGFVVGGGFGLIIGGASSGGSFSVAALLAIILGFVGGSAAIALQGLLVLLLGSLSAALVTMVMTGSELGDPLVLLMGVGGGIFALKLYSWTIILTTAVLGGMTISGVLTYEAGFGIADASFSLFTGIFWIVFLTGTAVQFGLFSHSKKLVEAEEDDSSARDTNVVYSDGGIQCESCNMPIHSEDWYCTHCGKRVSADSHTDEGANTAASTVSYAEADQYCVDCGVPSVEEYSYCRYCGNEVSEERLTSEPVYPRPKEPPPLILPDSMPTSSATNCSNCGAHNSAGTANCHYCDAALTT